MLATDSRPTEFHALYREQFAFVWSVARRFGVPSSALDDVVQEVFLTAYRRSDQLRFEVSARAWLYGVTRRVAAHHHRGAARRRRRDAALAAQPAPAREAPQERLLRARGVDALLDRLGTRTRAAWEMSELLGMSGPEIASELGLPLNTVYSRVRLARTQLQRALAEPQQLERWIADERARDVPPERAAQRSWLLLLPTLGHTSATIPALLTTRAAMLTTAILAVTVVILAPWSRPEPPAIATSAAPPAPAHPRAALVTPRPEPGPPAPPRDDRNASVRPGPSAHPGPSSPPAADRLAEEVALLDRAQARLNAGDASAALELLAAHTREFADGALIDLRESATVQALCLRGDPAAAALAAARLVQMHPRSAVAQRHINFRCPQ